MNTHVTTRDYNELLHRLRSLTYTDRHRLISDASLPFTQDMPYEPARHILAYLTMHEITRIGQTDVMWSRLARETMHSIFSTSLVDEASWAPLTGMNGQALIVMDSQLMRVESLFDVDTNEDYRLEILNIVCSVRSVTSGGDYAVIVSNDGQVFTWGEGNHGRLGHGDTDNQATPRVCDFPLQLRVVAVSAGKQHCLAVIENGDVYGWGANTHGQCGLGHVSAAVLRPTKILMQTSTPARVASVSDAPASFVITRDGRLFAFGNNRNGQLGIGDSSRPMPNELEHGNVVDNAGLFLNETLPMRVILPNEDGHEERVRGAAGGEFHSLAVTESGKVFSWGWTTKDIFMHQQFGEECRYVGNTTPTRQFNGDLAWHRVRSVTAEKHRSGAVTETGMVYVWGCDTLLQIGRGSEFFPALPQWEFNPRLVQGRLRRKHAVAISMNCDGTTFVVTNEGFVYDLHTVDHMIGILISGIKVNVIGRDQPRNGALDFVPH